MRAKIAGIAAAVIVAAAAAYALSPYLTGSTVDEAAPSNVVSESQPAQTKPAAEVPAEASGGAETTGEAGEQVEPAAEVPVEMSVAEPADAWFSGQFVGVGDGIHDASGSATVLPLDDGSRVLRLENFEATNGPGLYVYLASDKTAADHVSLGRLKANAGNQNYTIPDGVDLEKHGTVLIWCEPFSVLFGSAQLSG